MYSQSLSSEIIYTDQEVLYESLFKEVSKLLGLVLKWIFSQNVVIVYALVSVKQLPVSAQIVKPETYWGSHTVYLTNHP